MTTSLLEDFPFAKLLAAFEERAPSSFQDAHPFPHAVFDGLFDGDAIQRMHRQMRQLPDAYWEKNSDQGIEVKWRSKWQSEYDIPQPARAIVQFLNSGIFLKALSRLTGIDNLISDPYYAGGGFNLIQRGGYLDVHADGNWHDAMRVHRRLNLILYLNADWKPEWGGALEFYDAQAERVEASVLPVGNRLVMFETHDFSYHGHPTPLESPDGVDRTSIILYYYTSAPRPAQQTSVDEPHSALWRSKGWLDKRGNKTRTTF
jgi:Rps23 Pro-64 3,4-dihydroxylase Tpa1-like proline 4-hydroxylase